MRPGIAAAAELLAPRLSAVKVRPRASRDSLDGRATPKIQSHPRGGFSLLARLLGYPGGVHQAAKHGERSPVTVMRHRSQSIGCNLDTERVPSPNSPGSFTRKVDVAHSGSDPF